MTESFDSQPLSALTESGAGAFSLVPHVRLVRAWLVCSLLSVTILALTGWQLKHTHQLAIAAATERANSKSFLIAEWVSKSFDLKQYVLRETVNKFEAEELVYPPMDLARHQAQTQLLGRRAQSLHNMLFLGMLDANCIVTHTSIGVNLGFDAIENEREYCQLALSEPQSAFKVSNMFLSVEDTLNVTISVPLMVEQELRGFALAGLDLTFFQRWLDLIDMDQDHNVITLYDLNSRLLARKPLIAEQLGNQVVEPKLNAMALAELDQLESPFSHRLVSPVDGIDRVWSLRRIGELPFIVVVGEQTSNSLGSWRQQLNWYLMASVLLVLLLIISTRAYVRNLRQSAELEHLAITDPLTGLPNRRYFNQQFTAILARAIRSQAPLSFLIADLDHFKQINDRFGHDVGDAALCEVAKQMQSLVRQGDLIARWGGEEFVMLLPDTDLKGAEQLAARLAEAVQQVRVAEQQELTISIGLSSYRLDDSMDSMISRADSALFQAKDLGRNRIELGT